MFTIRQRPDGKWRLTKNDVGMGDFDSLAAAQEGMNRIILPVIYNYDEKGARLA